MTTVLFHFSLWLISRVNQTGHIQEMVNKLTAAQVDYLCGIMEL